MKVRFYSQPTNAFRVSVWGLVGQKRMKTVQIVLGETAVLQLIFPKVVLMSQGVIPCSIETNLAHSVASFLLKTFEILEKAEFSQIISWTQGDDSFAIKNILQFTNEILPKYFRHRNFSSFVRQLNMYDFHKIKQSNQHIVFRNPMFRKGQSHLLRNIRRKAPKKNQGERKVNFNVGSDYLQGSNQFRHVFQAGVSDSITVFEKCLLTLETLHSVIQKNNNLLNPDPSTKSCQSSILDVLLATKRLASVSFRSIASINYTIDQSLAEKQGKYQQVETRMQEEVYKNMSTLSRKSEEQKSECSIDYQRKLCEE